MRSRTSVIGSMPSARVCSCRQSVDSIAALSVSIAESEFFSCTSSRGVTRWAAMREAMRSRSPTIETCSRTASARSASCVKRSTTSSRSLIRAGSLIGMAIHRLSSRPPMGVSVRSITSAKLHFSRAPFEEKSSRLRIVNLSIHT